jgi:hypothetical protein
MRQKWRINLLATCSQRSVMIMMRLRHINSWVIFLLVFLLIFSTGSVFAASPRGQEARQAAQEQALANQEAEQEEEAAPEQIVHNEEPVIDEELLEEEIEALMVPLEGMMVLEYPEECNGPLVAPVVASTVPQYFSNPSGPASGWGDPSATLLPSPEDVELTRYKIDLDQNQIVDGAAYSDGTVTIKIFKSADNSTFAFESSHDIYHVYAKGGNDGGNLYRYYPTFANGVLEDCGLSQPGGNWSHITFFYGDERTQILGDIGGMKFHDLNADGELDLLTEMGLQGWTIELYDEEPGEGVDPIATTVTDAQGAFSFTDLQMGTYYIREVQQTDWIQSTPLDPDYFTVELTEEAPDYPYENDDPPLNFGNYQSATKSGYKFHDLNANGIWEDGEPELEDWTINLWQFIFDELEEKDVLTIVDTTTTDENGFYEFDNLKPGVNYFVSEEIPTGWFQSFPNQDAVDDENQNVLFVEGVGFVWGPVNLLSGGEETDNNFGNYQLGTKSGFKFNDLNNNSVWDDDEPVIAGWTINLWGFVPSEEDGEPDELVIIDTTTTDENGFYEFDNLIPGQTYFVSESQVTGWQQTFPVDLGDEAEAGDPFFYEPAGGVVYGPLVLESQEVREDNNFGNHRLPVYNDETAWAFGEEYANPNWNFVNNRFWGWTNGPLSAGSYEFDIYAGAGRNILSEGQVVGTLLINYNGSEVIVTYKMNPGIYLGEVHLWVGSEPLPKVTQGRKTIYTNAPGQFPYSDFFDFEEGEMVNEWTSMTIPVTGEIYVSAHAVVFIPAEE